MPVSRKSRNLFGWLRKHTGTTEVRLKRGEASPSAQAYRAGIKSGDTGEFDIWLRRKGYTKAPRDFQRRLEAQYRRGVERSGQAEQVKEARSRRAAEKKAEKRSALSSYKATRLFKWGTGEYGTSIDDSRFESLKDAKDFIDSVKNPRKGCSNPAVSAAQYRLAQAVLAGTARSKMPRKVAQEIVDRTPSNLRIAYMAPFIVKGLGPRSKLPNPFDSYSVCLFDGPSKLAFGEVSLDAPHLEAAQQKAQSYAESMGHDAVLYAPNGKAMGRFSVSGRRNPEPLPSVIPPDSEPDEPGSDEKRQAERIAKLFHGTAVRGEIIVKETMREQEHEWYVSIGPLVKLKGRTLLKRPFTLKFSLKPEALVHLFCSPDGKQFYLRGGDQEIDLGILGMGPGTDWFRDQMVIGQGKEITYRDRKKFHRFQLTDYYHKLGEETKVKPWVTFDTLNKKLGILGGQYRVETKELVDGMSPGIVN